MRLSDKIQGILGTVRENAGWLGLYPTRKHSLLLYAHRKGLVSDEDIDYALEQGVFDKARFFYNQVVTGEEYPDHVAYPEFLVHAILNLEFNLIELARIESRLDHEKNLAEFCYSYFSPVMIAKMREKLLAPKPDYSESSSSHADAGGFCDSCPPCFEH